MPPDFTARDEWSGFRSCWTNQVLTHSDQGRIPGPPAGMVLSAQTASSVRFETPNLRKIRFKYSLIVPSVRCTRTQFPYLAWPYIRD